VFRAKSLIAGSSLYPTAARPEDRRVEIGRNVLAHGHRHWTQT
jgi:hypothetical protein